MVHAAVGSLPTIDKQYSYYFGLLSIWGNVEETNFYLGKFLGFFWTSKALQPSKGQVLTHFTATLAPARTRQRRDFQDASCTAIPSGICSSCGDFCGHCRAVTAGVWEVLAEFWWECFLSASSTTCGSPLWASSASQFPLSQTLFKQSSWWTASGSEKGKQTVWGS